MSDTEKKRKYDREWRAANRPRSREHVRRCMYKARGLDPVAAEALLQAGTACEICGQLPGTTTATALGVDHDHATMKLRGVLCRTCNVALGFLRDSPRLCREAALYLQRSQHGPMVS